MSTNTYETGLSSHLANDTALSISNNGLVHTRVRVSYRLSPTLALAEIRQYCERYARNVRGIALTDLELHESADYVYDYWFAEEVRTVSRGGVAC